MGLSHVQRSVRAACSVSRTATLLQGGAHVKAIPALSNGSVLWLTRAAIACLCPSFLTTCPERGARGPPHTPFPRAPSSVAAPSPCPLGKGTLHLQAANCLKSNVTVNTGTPQSPDIRVDEAYSGGCPSFTLRPLGFWKLLHPPPVRFYLVLTGAFL